MSLYNVSGLPFWNEREISFRNECVQSLKNTNNFAEKFMLAIE